jgi:predicted nucleotidyltransferase
MDYKSRRIGEFGDNQLKGINLVIKGVAKRYNFITGWELAKDWDKYSVMILINLIVDLDKVGEYYDVKMQDYWLKEWKSDDFVDSHYILNLSEERTLDSGEEKNKLDKKINGVYEMIPDNLSTFYEFESDGNKRVYKCSIRINQFQNGPSQKMYFSI